MAYFKCSTGGGSSVEIDGVAVDGDLKLKKVVGDIKLPDLPYDFYLGSAVVYNNEIHILGGASSTTSHYKWDGSNWEEVSTLPYAFQCGSAVVYNNEIHILGGLTRNYYKAHYKYDGTSWTSVSTLPYDFYYGGAAVFNNEIHIYGTGASGNYTKHYKWNGTSWTSDVSIPMQFYGEPAATSILNGEIHIMGSQSSSYDNQHYKFDGTSWTKVGLLQQINRGACAVTVNNNIHLIGNYYYSTSTSSASIRMHDHYKYDGVSWEQCKPLPYGVQRSSAVSLNDEIYIMGGNHIGVTMNYNPSLMFYKIDVPVYSTAS